MRNLYTVAQIRDIETRAIDDARDDGEDLMRAAGASAARHIVERWPQARAVAVVVGAGNNGGDGWVVGRLLAERGLRVTVFESEASAQGVAAKMRDEYRAYTTADCRVASHAQFADHEFAAHDVLVDALIGIGLSRPLSDEALRLVEAMNAFAGARVALDVPSGLNADTGAAMPIATRANLTVTFIARKRGMHTGAARDVCGEVLVESLGVDAAATPTPYDLIQAEDEARRVPVRRAHAHKGQGGRALVVGGNTGYGGAARLAGEAAARIGAGLVSVVVRTGNLPMVAACPVLMAREINDATELNDLLPQCDIVALGPGLGRNAWGRAVFDATLASDKPMVVDADALYWLAESPVRRERWVLTPHAGEAATLLSATAAQIEADRFGAAARIVERYGGVCVLKGAGTLIGDAAGCGVCDDGGPAMASGGMGDVLTGVIAGLWAQKIKCERDEDAWRAMTLRDIARLGVCLHSRAADRAAAGRSRGVIASDLMGRFFEDEV